MASTGARPRPIGVLPWASMPAHVLDPVRDYCVLCFYSAETIERLRMTDCPQLSFADEIEEALREEGENEVDEEQRDG
jgi:hypothetical protein